MGNNYPLRQTARVLFFIGLAVILFFPGCKTGALKNQVMMLSEKQTFLAGERDSLQCLLNVKTHEFDIVYADYNALSTDFKTLTTKNKSLQSLYYSRGEHLKKMTQANANMSNAVSQMDTKNDSLQKEITALQDKIASIDMQMTESQKKNSDLAQTIRQQEEKIIADSIAEVNKPVSPVFKDHGYINITEVGGAFGLVVISVDYSRRLFSLNNISGYIINKNFLTGIGIGVHAYNGGTMIPLYIDMRYTFKESKLTPFIVADGGVLFFLKDIKSSGLFINPAIGLNKKLTGNVSLHLSSGVLIQEAPSGIRSTFINFKGGVSFKGK